MKVSYFAFAAAIGLGASGALLLTAPADAQRRGQPQAQPAAPAGPQFTREERNAIAPLYEAIQRRDYGAAAAALPAAQAGARSSHARYTVANLQFELALATQNEPLQTQAIEALLASGAAPADRLPVLLSNQAALAVRANDMTKAERALTRLVELRPNDPAALTQLAEVKIRMNRRNDAIPLYQRALQALGQNGTRPAESLYRRAVALAFDARSPAETMTALQMLLRAYPSAVNWRDSLLIFRDLAPVDGPLDLDLQRLQRAAGAFGGERDILEFATALNQAGHAGEAKAVLDEGVAQGMVDTAKPAASQLIAAVNRRAAQERPTLARVRTQGAAGDGRAARAAADTLFGNGQYAEAAELYRTALQKGGEDANLVNTRLGAALALAGSRAEAEAAFGAVTGQRGGLAQLWMAWLATRPA
jgi:predicted Zn-dependent protease